MIDIHTHLLPGMDDGPSSPEESMALLAELKRQGTDTAAATPHFYAEEETPAEFLIRRRKAFERLTEFPGYDAAVYPELRLGAEVLYYRGMSRTEALPELAIDGTGLLLVEMPFSEWSEYAVKEILTIQRERGLTVVLAHIDRYLGRRNEAFMDDMRNEGVLMQINAGSLTGRSMRRKVLGLLKQKKIAFVASDCHGMEHRPPELDKAYDLIAKKLGEDYDGWLIRCSEKMFAR